MESRLFWDFPSGADNRVDDTGRTKGPPPSFQRSPPWSATRAFLTYWSSADPSVELGLAGRDRAAVCGNSRPRRTRWPKRSSRHTARKWRQARRLDAVRDQIGYHAAWARWSATADELAELANQI